MLRAWVNTLNFLSTVESAIADRIGETGAMFGHFLTFWGAPIALLYVPSPIFPILGIALAGFYIFVITGDIILSVFGHEELEFQRGMLDITSVREMRKEILAALIKYAGGVLSFATIYNGLQQLHGGTAFHFNAASGLHYFDLLYFSLITIATVGYGDVYPAVVSAKVAAMLEVVFGLGFAILLFSMLVSLYIDLQRRKDAEPPGRAAPKG